MATIRDAIESADGASKSDPLGHKLVTRLLAAYLDEVSAADAKKAEIEAQLEAAETGEEEDEGGADDASDGADAGAGEGTEEGAQGREGEA